MRALDGPTGGQMLDHPGFTAIDHVFDRQGGFGFWRTCYVWMGEMLGAAGLRFGLWMRAPQSVRVTLAWQG